MALEDSIIRKLTILEGLNPEEKSVTFDAAQKNLIGISKRSALCNFFTWIIHKIFPCFARNRDLDEVAQAVLNEVNTSLDAATDEEKALMQRAIVNLGQVIDKNGGAKQNDIQQTLRKIQGLSVVKDLQPEPPTPFNTPVTDRHAQVGSGESDNDNGGTSEENPNENRLSVEVQPHVHQDAGSRVSCIFPTISSTADSSTPLPINLQALISGKTVAYTFNDLIFFAENLLMRPVEDSNRASGLQLIVKRIEKLPAASISLQSEKQREILTALFENFNQDAKVLILSKALEGVFLQKNKIYHELLNTASESVDPVLLWQNAMKVALKKLPKNLNFNFEDLKKTNLLNLPVVRVLAILETIFLKDLDFASKLYAYYFAPNKSSRIQYIFLENVNPDFFKLFIPSIQIEGKENPWLYFLEVLGSILKENEEFEGTTDALKNLHSIIDNVIDHWKKTGKDEKDLLIFLTKTKNVKYLSLLAYLLQNPCFYEETNVAQFVECFRDENENNPLILTTVVLKTLENVIKKTGAVKKTVSNVNGKQTYKTLKDQSYDLGISTYKIRKGYEQFHHLLLAFILEQTNNLVSDELRLKCVHNLDYPIIQQYISTLFSKGKPTPEQVLKLLPLLKFSDVQTYLLPILSSQSTVQASQTTFPPTETAQTNVLSWYKPNSSEIIKYDQLLPFVTNPNHLKKILEPIFLAKDEKYFNLLFSHLEKEPWKALFLARDIQVESREYLKEWLEQQNKVDQNKFLQCYLIFKNIVKLENPYHEELLLPPPATSTSNLSVEESNSSGEESEDEALLVNSNDSKEKNDESRYYESQKKELQVFFKYENYIDIIAKNNTFKRLDKTIKDYLLNSTRCSSPDALLRYFLIIHPSQLAMSLFDNDSSKKILEALDQNGGILTEIALEKITTITSKIKEELSRSLETVKMQIRKLKEEIKNSNDEDKKVELEDLKSQLIEPNQIEEIIDNLLLQIQSKFPDKKEARKSVMIIANDT